MESPFNSGEINEIRKNKQSRIIVAELCRPNQKLTTISQSNRGIDCKVSGPFKRQIQVWDDIPSWSWYWPWKIKMWHVQLANIERFKTRKYSKLLPSPTLKLAVNDECLPVSISIEIFSFRVRPYVFNPIQCYNCQRIGHTASSCKAKQCCLHCGGGHSRDDCMAEVPQCAIAMESIELTHLSALWYSMHMTLSSWDQRVWVIRML